MTIKLKPRPVATGSRLRDNNQAGKLINPQHTPPAALPQAAHVRARCFDRPAPVSAAAAWRRLRRFIPVEPRRITLADIERALEALPYGRYIARDGREILFNRAYQPIWEKLPNGEIRRANPHEWIDWVRQAWLELGSMRYEKSARAAYRKALRDFFEGKTLLFKNERKRARS